uniref:Uncharacterized protein n=1 Tax=Cannabis sativa TaxID=3483 RepID=A0A803QEK1_CANSA
MGFKGWPLDLLAGLGGLLRKVKTRFRGLQNTLAGPTPTRLASPSTTKCGEESSVTKAASEFEASSTGFSSCGWSSGLGEYCISFNRDHGSGTERNRCGWHRSVWEGFLGRNIRILLPIQLWEKAIGEMVICSVGWIWEERVEGGRF